jgi:uncharacterized protein (TIGR00251 family)
MALRVYAVVFFHVKEGALFAHVQVVPNADRDAIVGIVQDEYGRDYLKIRIKAVPEKGKANKALLKFLAKEWGCTQTELEIVSKPTIKTKTIRVPCEESEMKRWLEGVS